MKEANNKKVNTNILKRFVTNAGSDIKETIGEGRVPVSSEETVEEARDWVDNGSRL